MIGLSQKETNRNKQPGNKKRSQMSQLKEQVIRDLETLSTEDLHAVHQFVEQLKEAGEPHPVERKTVDQVRKALSEIPGNLSETITREREERI